MKRRDFITRTLAGAAVTVGSPFSTGLSAAPEEQKLLASGGGTGRSSSSYTRMFPGLGRKPSRPLSDSEEGLTELGRAMADRDPPLEEESQPDLPTAGYTYLGQFIDHDLTLDLTPLARASPNVEDTPNFRSSFLDLDHVYGGGPTLSPFLYEKGGRGAERFLIGKTKDDLTLAEDLPRNAEGIALTGDPRQDENLILAQLHVAFLKLHNVIVADSALLSASPWYRRPGHTDFDVARRIVTWHYQWVVRHDYLQQMLDPEIFERLPELERAKRNRPVVDFRIPVEFSVAAFRFGHSMVRDQYKTGVNRQHEDVSLPDLLGLTGSMGGASPALPTEWVVSWERFFMHRGGDTAHLNRIRKIDTQIANGLHHVEQLTTKPFAAQTAPGSLPSELPVRTLLRGARVELPSGEDVAREISRRDNSIRILTEDEIVSGDHKDILTNPRYGLLGNTPLWYYLLKEAELHKNEARQPGRSLGPIGSYIIADVILDALVADRDSYLSVPNWSPTIPTMYRGEGDSMSNVLAFIAASTGRSNT
jgi:hypothetical protein